MDRGALDLVDEVHPAHEVAPLVVAADLQGAAVASVELEVVVGLEDLVAELGVGDALLAGQAPGDDVLGEHGAHAEVLAQVPQEVNGAHRLGPVQVVDDLRRVVPAEVEKVLELFLQAGRPAGNDVLGVEAALPLGARVADEAGRPTHQRQRTVPGQLKMAHDLDGYEVPVVKARRRGVEPAIEGDGPVAERRSQRVNVGVLGDEPAPLQFVQDVRHCPVAFRGLSCLPHA